ncbi:MAG: hypothetical protein A3J27_08870 [Candidatus Tectomicrobia bacterium RIFCSPLOWO2_12_FULL_69_37]|nr:MAG: hypothetical protein A3J27_08870 [Candidatus Tectomicrobia bacterium RIFCSPLOWO2_12_FULL_69_37]
MVTIGHATDPPTMDPNATSDALGFVVWGWAYDTLVKYNLQKKETIPWLAEKWEKLGPTSFKFWLRKDAKFSDGTPVTAHAVKFTMDRIFDKDLKSRQRGYFQTFKSIEVLDDHTFIWHQKGPDNGLFGRLHNWFLIINPKSKGVDKAKVSLNTYGGGPYVLKSWTKGSKMVFEANPHWWGNRQYPDRPQTVALRPIREATTRVKALLTGELDFIQGVDAQFIPELQKDPNTKVVVVPGMRIFYLAFAMRHGGPFADPKVRQAVNYAIDSDLIGKTIMGGLTDPFHMLYHPWSFSGYNPGLKWFGYDLAKAKALMKEAGYPNGFKAVFVAPNGRFVGDRETGEAVSAMLKKIGIDMKVEAYTWPLYRRAVNNAQEGKTKEPALVWRSWGNSVGDTTGVWRGTSSCTGVWSVSCFPELDKLNEEAGAMADPEMQQAAFEKLWGKMKEQAMHKILFKFRETFGLRKTLRFEPRGDETIAVWEMVQTK